MMPPRNSRLFRIDREHLSEKGGMNELTRTVLTSTDRLGRMAIAIGWRIGLKVSMDKSTDVLIMDGY